MSEALHTVTITLSIKDGPGINASSPDVLRTIAIKALRSTYNAWNNGPIGVGLAVRLTCSVDGNNVTPLEPWAGRKQKGD